MHWYRPASTAICFVRCWSTHWVIGEGARHQYSTAVYRKHLAVCLHSISRKHKSQHSIKADRSFSSVPKPKDHSKKPLSEEAKLELARDIVGVRPTDRIPRIFPAFTILLFACFLAYEYMLVQPNLPDQPEPPTSAPTGVAKVLADGRLLMDDGRIVKPDSKP